MNTVTNTNRDLSRAGCEFRHIVDNFKFHMRDLQANICMMKAMNPEVIDGKTVYYEYVFNEEFIEQFEEEVDEGDFEEGDFGGASGSESAPTETNERVRIALIDDKLTVDICNDESGSMKQIISLVVVVKEGKFEVDYVDHFNPVWDPTIDESLQATLVAAGDDPSQFEDGDTAEISFKNSSPYWGTGQIDLSVLNSGGTILNELSAAFKSSPQMGDGGTWTSLVAGMADGDQGCSIWQGNGTFPPMRVGDHFRDDYTQKELKAAGWLLDDLFCWKGEGEVDESKETTVADWIEDPNSAGQCEFSEGGPGTESIECFTYEVTEGNVLSYVYDQGGYRDEVLAMSLPSHSDPTISFGNTWDCEVEDTPSEIDVAGIGPVAFDACFAYADMAQDNDRDIESCYEIEHSNEAQDEFIGDMNNNCANKAQIDMNGSVDTEMADICSCLNFTGDKCTTAEITCADAYNAQECMEWLVGFGVSGEGQDIYLCQTVKENDPYNAENMTKLCASDCYNLDTTSCANTEDKCTKVGALSMGECVDILFGYYDEEQFKEENSECSGVDFAKNTDQQLTAFCTCFEIQSADCTPLATTCKGVVPDVCLDKLVF